MPIYFSKNVFIKCKGEIKMKQRMKFIIALVMWIIVAVAITGNVKYAVGENLNVSIVADNSSYSIGDDIEVTIKLNKKVMTSSYYLKYDSSKMTYKTKKQVRKGSLTVKDYPSENTLRVAYFDADDESELGIDEMTFIFTANENISSVPEFNLENTTMTIQGVDDPIKQNDIGGINNSKNTLDKVEESKISENTVQKDNSMALNNLPQTGGNITFFILLISIVILIIYILYSFVKKI